MSGEHPAVFCKSVRSGVAVSHNWDAIMAGRRALSTAGPLHSPRLLTPA